MPLVYGCCLLLCFVILLVGFARRLDFFRVSLGGDFDLDTWLICVVGCLGGFSGLVGCY